MITTDAATSQECLIPEPASSSYEAPARTGNPLLAVALAAAVMTAGGAFLGYRAGAASTVNAARVAASTGAANETVSGTVSAMVATAERPGVEDIKVIATAEAAAEPTPDTAAVAASGERVATVGLSPRLKPSPRSAPPDAGNEEISAVAPAPLSIAAAVSAQAPEPPPSVFFLADIDPAAARFRSARLELAGDLPSEPADVAVRLLRGETLVDALRRAGVRPADRNAAASALAAHVNLRRLQPDAEFGLRVAKPHQTLFQHAVADGADDARLVSLNYRVDAENRIELLRGGAGFTLEKRAIPVTAKLATISGRIDGSLFQSARAAGAPVEVVGRLANMFAYDVDFQRDIFGGDEFEAVFELRYDDQGEVVGAGDVMFARLKWRGRSKEKAYYRHEFAHGGVDYFDRAGQSAKRLLMKTPIDGARLSSGFGTRNHPILGYRKAHKGVDFAASRGTPVFAAGDGVVLRADRFSSFGNYVRIRHSSGYETAYAHLNGFRKGLKKGARVRQGDVIGYVGSTGRSTGPHLHYEVHHNGAAVNPQSLKIATGTSLSGGDLAAFKARRDEIDALRNPAPVARPLLAREDAVGQTSL